MVSSSSNLGSRGGDEAERRLERSQLEERVCLEAEAAFAIEMDLSLLLLLLMLGNHKDDDGLWLKQSGLEADAAYVRVKLLSISGSALFFSFFLSPEETCGKDMENKFYI